MIYAERVYKNHVLSWKFKLTREPTSHVNDLSSPTSVWPSILINLIITNY